MTFSYGGDLSTDKDYIRFTITDTVENAGPKPNNGNYSDEEIAGLVTSQGSQALAIAALYDNLATAWARFVDSKIGPRDEKLSQTAKAWQARASQWRADNGIGKTLFIGYLNEGLDATFENES